MSEREKHFLLQIFVSKYCWGAMWWMIGQRGMTLIPTYHDLSLSRLLLCQEPFSTIHKHLKTKGLFKSSKNELLLKIIYPPIEPCDSLKMKLMIISCKSMWENCWWELLPFPPFPKWISVLNELNSLHRGGKREGETNWNLQTQK